MNHEKGWHSLANRFLQPMLLLICYSIAAGNPLEKTRPLFVTHSSSALV